MIALDNVTHNCTNYAKQAFTFIAEVTILVKQRLIASPVHKPIDMTHAQRPMSMAK